MKYYAIGIGLLAAFLWVGLPTVEAQTERDRFVVVEAADLAENPQRYWSRGIVFEDTLKDVTGRSRRVEGRRLVQIETETVGLCYVDEDLIDRVGELDRNRAYLFAGTVLGEMRRRFPFFRQRSEYIVALDTVEVLADEVEEDLLQVFLEADPDRPAFQNVQKAVVQAQNRLVAFAKNEGVDIADLFDPGAATMDRAAEVSRVAVRSVQEELGVTSMELLSQLIRELLAKQYLEETEWDVEHEDQPPEPEEALIIEPEAIPSLDAEQENALEALELDSEEAETPTDGEIEEQEELESGRGILNFWRSSDPENGEAAEDRDE